MNHIQPIHISKLTHEFGGLRAVDNISFDINKGELVGLIGPNGCGKSTTFNCISGLLKPMYGHIEILGNNTAGLRPDQIHKLGITRTFQHTRLWKEMTVIENILVSSKNQFSPNPILSLFSPNSTKYEKERLHKAYEILDSLELSHGAHNLAGNLSGGQKKLLELGRTMMVDAKLVLLDEVGAGVNRTLLKDIGTAILRLNKEQGYTFCMIEHDMDFISRLCDPVIVMAEGSVLFEGTSDEVKKNEKVIESYLGRGSKSKEGDS